MSKAGYAVSSIAGRFAPDEIAVRLRLSKAAVAVTQDVMPRAGKVLEVADISGIFGLDLDTEAAPAPAKAALRKSAQKPRAAKPKHKKKS